MLVFLASYLRKSNFVSVILRKSMKNPILYIAFLLLCNSCSKSGDAVIEQTTATLITATSAPGFTKYTIKSGQHYADGNTFKIMETAALNFVVKFDSTAIYQSALKENQYDINKLYGFSDNNQGHHLYSARFGWRWSDNALRLFAYVYNEGTVSSKELTAIGIGQEVACRIRVTPTDYLFTVGDKSDSLRRMSTTPLAKGYQLYPYFGGDETAPHEVSIWIK
jgi:hypothetical protein